MKSFSKFAFSNPLRSKFRKTFESKVENDGLIYLLVDFHNYIRKFEVARAIQFFKSADFEAVFVLT